MQSSSYPRPVGRVEDPFGGRIWLRKFPGGDAELVYKGSGDGPSETEALNAWLEDSGVDNRVLPGRKGYWTPGVEPDPDDSARSKESDADRVARRAKQQVRWKCKALQADRLMTLTVRENLADYDLARKAAQKFLAACRRTWPTWRFVMVAERQERGAWHFHLAVKGWQNVDKLRGLWWRALGRRVRFDEAGKPHLVACDVTPGNVDITSPRVRGRRGRVWSVDKLAGYLSKYIGKTIGSEECREALDGRASYAASRGLDHVVERFCVRALTFLDVVSCVFDVLHQQGLRMDYQWQASDRSVLWAAARVAPPPEVR